MHALARLALLVSILSLGACSSAPPGPHGVESVERTADVAPLATSITVVEHVWIAPSDKLVETRRTIPITKDQAKELARAKGVGKVDSRVKAILESLGITSGGVFSGVSGGLGSSDNRALRANGTGGSTAQGSSVTIEDSGQVSWPTALGNIVHVLGPSDQALNVHAGVGQPAYFKTSDVASGTALESHFTAGTGTATGNGGIIYVHGANGVIGGLTSIYAGTGTGTAGNTEIDAGPGPGAADGTLSLGTTAGYTSAVTIGQTTVAPLFPGAVVIASADTSGARLEVNAGRLDAREGDDSALAPAGALSYVVGSADTSGVLLSVNSGNLCFREGDNSALGIAAANNLFVGAMFSGFDSDANAIAGAGAGRTTCFGTTSTGARVAASYQYAWSSNAAGSADAFNNADTGIARSAAGVLKATNGSTGYGEVRSLRPRRAFAVHKTPGTAATLTVVGGTPTHTLTGTASNVSDASGHYVQLSGTSANAGIDIATTECTKTENGPVLTFVVKTGGVLPVATERLWVGVSSASLAAADSPTGAHVLAFRYAPTADGTAFWRAVSNDSGADTGTTTVSTAAIAVSTRYVLTIDATNSASVTFYVNGALVATHATNLPTVTQALGTQCVVNDVAGGSTKELLVSNISFETN